MGPHSSPGAPAPACHATPEGPAVVSPLGADPPTATAVRLPKAPGLGTLHSLTLSAWSLWPGNQTSGPGSGELILGTASAHRKVLSRRRGLAHGPGPRQERSEAASSEARADSRQGGLQGAPSRAEPAQGGLRNPRQGLLRQATQLAAGRSWHREGRRSRMPSLADVPVRPGAPGGHQGTLLRSIGVLATWEGISSWAFGSLASNTHRRKESSYPSYFATTSRKL